MKDHSMPTLLIVDDQRSCAEVVKIAIQGIACETLYESRKDKAIAMARRPSSSPRTRRTHSCDHLTPHSSRLEIADPSLTTLLTKNCEHILESFIALLRSVLEIGQNPPKLSETSPLLLFSE
jgi:hypothetical protein